MSKSRSHTDQAAIFQHAFNEEHGALEVVLVGSELKVDNMTQNISVDTSKMEAQLEKLIQAGKGTDKEELTHILADAFALAFDHKRIEVIKVPEVIRETHVEVIEVPTLVEKIVEVERVVEVIKEVPGPTKIEVVQVTVDREVVVTKTEYKDLSKLLITGLALQGLIQILTVLLHK